MKQCQWIMLMNNANYAYIDPVKVIGIHDGTLEELDLSEVPLEQAFQFQVRLLSVGQGFQEISLIISIN